VSYYLNVTTKANQKHLFHFTSPLGGHCIAGVITCLNLVSYYLGPLYTRSKVSCSTQIKHSKVEISPKGFTLGVMAELEKLFSVCPKLLINAELYGLVLAPRMEKGYH
jgi:hypothetical protein